MTEIILVRHGQSTGNLLSEFHGQYNSDLTEKGHAQAECTACFLDNYHIDKIYASDIKRAFSTALHIANHKDLEVIPNKAFREINAGDWEQMKFNVIEEKYPELHSTWYNNISKCKLPNGESVSELYDRVTAEFDKLARENDGKTILIATHATPIRALFCHILKQGIDGMQNLKWVTNASVTIVKYHDNEYEFVLKGEDSHLKKASLLTELPKNI